MTITAMPEQAAPPGAVSVPPDAVSAPGFAASGAPAAVSGTDKRNPIGGPPAAFETTLRCVAGVLGLLVGGIGFATSYHTLAAKAVTWGFGDDLAHWFPVGVDASILAFLALDLYLILRGIPWPLLRMAAHGMTGATIWFNASAQGAIGADPVKAASHAVMPILFVIGVEAGRRLFIQKAQLEAGTAVDRIPLHRWMLSPVATPRLYRRMRLYGITSYPEMIRRQQDLLAYEQWLKRQHRGDLSTATEDERLPMKMARYGFTVAQALALPDQQQREAEARAEEAEQRRLEAETRQELAQKQAEADRLLAEGRLEAVRAQVSGETAQARAQARAQATAAERAAQLEAEALESAAAAEARAREAAAERAAADDRRAAAESDCAAAETARAAAETRRAAAEMDARRAEEERREEAVRAEAARAEQDAAESLRLAAETRRAAAEIERAAVEAEDAARLTPRERAVRRVARMALTAGLVTIGLSYNEIHPALCRFVTIADVQRALDVSSTDTASRYRQEAAALIADGYRP